VAANLLFIASFRVVSAGTGATIYRLNLVLVAVLGVVLLGEPVTPWKVVGIGLGGAAVVLIRNGAPHERLARIGALSLLLACGLRAIMGVLYKLSSTTGVPPFEMLTIGGLCWVGGGLAFSVSRHERLWPSRRVAGFALLSGLLVCGIVYFMLAATRRGEASIVVPITQLSFTITTLLGVAFHREPLRPRKALALAAAVGCVLVLSLA
jgi:drug/metabolite transporter (DMT)-like permease